MFPKTVTWKEEVKLSDSSILIVTRTNHLVPPRTFELAQRPTLDLEWTSLEFQIPGTDENAQWKSVWTEEDLASDALTPLGVDVIKGRAYLVAMPSDCRGVAAWHWPQPQLVF